MKRARLTAKDRALIDAARDAIKHRYRNEWQEVGAALRTRDGRIITGVNIDAYLGRMAVCAEAVALGQAITSAGETGIEMIVAVRHPPPEEKDSPIAVVSPTTGRTCSNGMCSTSATIIAIEAREPPISGWPSVTVTVPSSLTCTAALDSPPALCQ